MYEPGMTNTKNKQTGLTPLKSVDQKIKLNENVQKEGHNLLNLENSEDEDFQDVVNKNKQK